VTPWAGAVSDVCSRQIGVQIFEARYSRSLHSMPWGYATHEGRPMHTSHPLAQPLPTTGLYWRQPARDTKRPTRLLHSRASRSAEVREAGQLVWQVQPRHMARFSGSSLTLSSGTASIDSSPFPRCSRSEVWGAYRRRMRPRPLTGPKQVLRYIPIYPPRRDLQSSFGLHRRQLFRLPLEGFPHRRTRLAKDGLRVGSRCRKAQSKEGFRAGSEHA